MDDNDENLNRINDVVGNARIGVLTTRDSAGALHARPLSLKTDDVRHGVRFLVLDGSESVASVRSDPQVNIAVQHGTGYVSLAGTARVTADAQTIDELWSPAAEAWFPEGREDPRIRVLEVSAQSAEYWVLDKNVVSSAVSMIKAATGHGTPDVGKNESVEL